MDWLAPAPGKTIVDGTFGGGGHSRLIADQIGDDGTLIAMDRDSGAIQRFGGVMADASARIELINDSYHSLPQVMESLDIGAVDGILLDLGLSSDQLADRQRGFSYQSDGPLDLRFDDSCGESAAELLRRLPEKAIADLIYQFGEERFSRRIARKIAERRKQRNAVRTAQDLAELVRRCVPRSKNHSIDPATRTFQALRIAVNQELDIVRTAMQRLPQCLSPGGRLVVITFHSLEDRIVKHTLRESELLTIETKKPLTASTEEIANNARSRSAKLRVATRV